ncbi:MULTISPECIES: zinc-binding alcohol dehydrogenase family protein [Thalassospira]|nr:MULTISPECIES: zinc-binding alcohol dehydrogenase family protein [Thalassospira]MDG4717824.1 zinc-binding alcohol dehydrogenase family protein [Thalassospira sp. FZY0004]
MMKSLVCREPGILELEKRDKPSTADADHVLVDIKHVGVCGTDFHIYEGLHPYLEYPRVMGHELGGVVAKPACGFKQDDVVIINPYLACGTCRACQRGKPNCCYQIKVLGVHCDGGMCERISVPAKNLYPAGDLPVQHAAMVEFMAIGAHAVRRSEVTSDDRVLVVGVGPIGLGVALFAKAQGAEVHLLDFSQDRLEMASDRFGFSRHHDAKRSPSDILAATDGEGFDVVYDATGNQKAMQSGFQYVAHGGSFVLVSVVHGDISFADPEFHKREMKLIGSRNATSEDFERVLSAFRSGEIDANALNTHVCTMDEFPEKIMSWVHNRDKMIKAIISV